MGRMVHFEMDLLIGIRLGAVESVFLMLIEPANPVATMEVDIDVVGTDGEDGFSSK